MTSGYQTKVEKKFFEKATENNFSKDTVFEFYVKHERIQKTWTGFKRIWKKVFRNTF